MKYMSKHRILITLEFTNDLKENLWIKEILSLLNSLKMMPVNNEKLSEKWEAKVRKREKEREVKEGEGEDTRLIP